MSGIEWWNSRRAWERIRACEFLGWSSHLAFVPASEDYLTLSEIMELETVTPEQLIQFDRENEHA